MNKNELEKIILHLWNNNIIDSIELVDLGNRIDKRFSNSAQRENSNVSDNVESQESRSCFTCKWLEFDDYPCNRCDYYMSLYERDE